MIDLENLEFQRDAFRLNCSLSISKGELVTLLGPSGSGKTTLLRLLAGFLEDYRGSIRLDGRNMQNIPPHLREVGYLFQDLALFPHLNVRDNILFGISRKDYGDRDRILSDMLRITGLDGYASRRIHQLSGGEKQRVALARALVPHPKILLLDEPLSALDREIENRLGEEIRAIHRMKGLTTLWVSHNQEQAMNLSDRILLFRNGSLAEQGTPRELYERPRSGWSALFLGPGTLIPVLESDSRRLRSAWGDYPAVKDAAPRPRNLLIRPEWIRLKPGKGDARVESSVFESRGFRRFGRRFK